MAIGALLALTLVGITVFFVYRRVNRLRECFASDSSSRGRAGAPAGRGSGSGLLAPGSCCWKWLAVQARAEHVGPMAAESVLHPWLSFKLPFLHPLGGSDSPGRDAAPPSPPWSDVIAPLLSCRTSAAHPPVQVPEERQSDVLWPEDHAEGDLAAGSCAVWPLPAPPPRPSLLQRPEIASSVPGAAWLRGWGGLGRAQLG